MRIFLDTNILLDIALRRPSFFAGSQRALEKCEMDSCELLFSWHTVSNLFYLLRRDRGAQQALEFLEHLLEISTVATVGHQEALRAVGLGLNDFEDALQLSAAESCRADLILTRNAADFGNAPIIPVMAPDEYAPQA